jgi:hypothetical protein
MAPSVSAPNERTRLYLAHAIVTRGELQVTHEWNRWGQIFDIARYKDQFYSDKAPGSSLLIAPAVAVYTKINPDYTIEDLLMVGRRFMLIATCLALLALGATLVRLGVSEPLAALAMGTLALGSNLVHYGHSFFGHGLVMTCILGMCWAMVAALQQEDRRRQLGLLLLAGLCSGGAFAVEYQGALITLALLAGLLLDPQTRHPRIWLPAMLGAVPPVLVTLGYNYLAFDNPFTTSYGLLYFEVSKEVHARGLWGISLPAPDAICGLLLSPARGLLFSCPALLCGLSLEPATQPSPRWLRATLLLILGAYMYVVTSFGVWAAGWGLGPRLLIPILAPLALLYGLRLPLLMRSRAAAPLLALSLVSALSNLLLTVTFAEVPSEILVPLRSIALPLLMQGSFSPGLLPGWLLIALVSACLVAALVALVRHVRPKMDWRLGLLVALIWPLLMWTFPEPNRAAVKSHLDFAMRINKR